jgi:hypothetical protein
MIGIFFFRPLTSIQKEDNFGMNFISKLPCFSILKIFLSQFQKLNFNYSKDKEKNYKY